VQREYLFEVDTDPNECRYSNRDKEFNIQLDEDTKQNYIRLDDESMNLGLVPHRANSLVEQRGSMRHQKKTMDTIEMQLKCTTNPLH
jgi:hypothetical protein